MSALYTFLRVSLRRPLALALGFTLSVAACRVGRGPHCGPDGHPPHETIPGSRLLVGGDQACPRNPPAEVPRGSTDVAGGACALDLESGTSSAGERQSRVWCEYAA